MIALDMAQDGSRFEGDQYLRLMPGTTQPEYLVCAEIEGPGISAANKWM
jgi:hypothetical protein